MGVFVNYLTTLIQIIQGNWMVAGWVWLCSLNYRLYLFSVLKSGRWDLFQKDATQILHSWRNAPDP